MSKEVKQDFYALHGLSYIPGHYTYFICRETAEYFRDCLGKWRNSEGQVVPGSVLEMPVTERHLYESAKRRSSLMKEFIGKGMDPDDVNGMYDLLIHADGW